MIVTASLRPLQFTLPFSLRELWLALATQHEEQGITNEGLTKKIFMHWKWKVGEISIGTCFPWNIRRVKICKCGAENVLYWYSSPEVLEEMTCAWYAYLLHFLWVTAWGSETIKTKSCVLVHIKLVNRLKREEFLGTFNSDQNWYESNNQDI